MRLDLCREKGYLSMKDDLERNVENKRDKDNEIRYGCDSIYIYKYLF